MEELTVIDYPDQFLAIMIPTHIILGAIGAFILCPLAFTVKKYSSWHRVVGKLFEINAILIALSGCSMLLDSLFVAVYWAQESDIKGFASIFESSHYRELFFLFLSVILIYMTFSATRIWKRIDHGKAERIQHGVIDYLLTGGMTIFAGIFFVVGIYDIIHADLFGVYFSLASVLMLSFVIFDIYTYWKRPRVKAHKWWIHHLVRITCAWAGLLDAFWIRINPILIEKGYTTFAKIHFGTYSWLILIFLGFLFYRRRLKA